jgi:hypothetical protein
VSLLCFCGNSIAGPTGQERHEENKTRHQQSSANHIDRLNLLARVRTAAGRDPKAPCGAFTIPFGLGLICRQGSRGNRCGSPDCFIKIKYTNFEILFLLIVESSITFNIVKQAAQFVGFRPCLIDLRCLLPLRHTLRASGRILMFFPDGCHPLLHPTLLATHFCCAENWSDDAGRLEAKDAGDVVVAGKVMTSISASCRIA